MSRATQVSVPISEETKDLLDQEVKATGVRRGYLIESALRYHLRALHELPADVLVPARLVLTRRSLEQVAERLSSPGQPTDELRDLMHDDGE
jgi:uncharacterized protein (DUF1778 family)